MDIDLAMLLGLDNETESKPKNIKKEKRKVRNPK